MSETYNKDDGVPSYIKDLINQIADREGYKNYSITHSAGSNAGDGFLGDLLRFKICGMQNNTLSSLSLICKMPPTSTLRRIEYNTDVTFGREIYLYGYLLPYILEFQNENGVSEADGFNSFPKCYATVLDEKPNGDHAIVMEDLVSSKYYMWDKFKKIDYEHAKLVMEELGKFHAVSFAIREKNPEKLNEIRNKGICKFHKIMYSSEKGLEFYNINIKKAIDALEPNEIELIEKLKANDLHEMIDKVFSNTTPEPFGVLVHGDIWNNNIMYQNSDNDIPTKLRFVDWQLSQFGSPALDVVHYIFCSLDEVTRSEHYHEFMDLYYKSLVRTLKIFGCDDQKLFTFADLKDQCKKYGRVCLHAGPILCQIMTLNPANLRDIDDMIEEWEEAKEKGDTTAVSVDLFGDVSESYKDRMSHLLRDCVREGFF